MYIPDWVGLLCAGYILTTIFYIISLHPKEKAKEDGNKTNS